MLGSALGAGLIWLAVFVLVTLQTRIPPRGRAGAGPGLAGIPAALVNLVVTEGRPWSVLMIPPLIAIALAVYGLAALSRYLAVPAKAAFTAQVIARWEEDFERGDDTTVRVYRYAVDDGQQTWCGEVSQVDFARIRVGEMVQVHAAPRNRRLTGLDFTRPAS
jgi:hypothetical protein